MLDRMLGLVLGLLTGALVVWILALIGAAVFHPLAVFMVYAGWLVVIPFAVLGWYDGAYLAGRIVGKALKLLK